MGVTDLNFEPNPSNLVSICFCTTAENIDDDIFGGLGFTKNQYKSSLLGQANTPDSNQIVKPD